MKYLKQFLIIIGISFLGELLKLILPLPIPASIYGMILMFAGLSSNVIKLESVKECGKFLVEIMPVMFIPAGVGLITSWSKLRPILIPVMLITVITLFTVIFATGHVSQFIIKRSRNKEGRNAE